MAADIDVIYEALCKTCDVLDQISCDYFLAGGTLLGALREGDLIPHDIDFDLDCLIKDEESILGAKDLFEANGLTVRRKLSTVPRRFDTFEQTTNPLNASCIVVEYKGEHVGDIFIFTVFDDGIARRFDLIDGVYANPKMSIPSWYYSGETYLEIRGRKFRSVRTPELVLEKVYGDDWKIPLKPGQFQEGRQRSSGSVPDADIENLVIYAIENGWQPMNDFLPKWPQPLTWVAWPPKEGREWIIRHEVMLREDVMSLIQSETFLNLLETGDNFQKTTLLKVLIGKTLKSENERLHKLAQNSKKPSLFRRLYEALDLPYEWREFFAKTYHKMKWR